MDDFGVIRFRIRPKKMNLRSFEFLDVLIRFVNARRVYLTICEFIYSGHKNILTNILLSRKKFEGTKKRARFMGPVNFAKSVNDC